MAGTNCCAPHTQPCTTHSLGCWHSAAVSCALTSWLGAVGHVHAAQFARNGTCGARVWQRAATLAILSGNPPSAYSGASDRPYMHDNKSNTCVAAAHPGRRVRWRLTPPCVPARSSLKDRLLAPFLRLFGAHVAKPPHPRLRRSRRVPNAAAAAGAMAPGHVAAGAAHKENSTPSKRPAAQSLMTQSTRKRAKGTCPRVSDSLRGVGGCPLRACFRVVEFQARPH